jgi:hypothetical protein
VIYLSYNCTLSFIEVTLPEIAFVAATPAGYTEVVEQTRIMHFRS